MHRTISTITHFKENSSIFFLFCLPQLLYCPIHPSKINKQKKLTLPILKIAISSNSHQSALSRPVFVNFNGCVESHSGFSQLKQWSLTINFAWWVHTILNSIINSLYNPYKWTKTMNNLSSHYPEGSELAPFSLVINS